MYYNNIVCRKYFVQYDAEGMYLLEWRGDVYFAAHADRF